MKLPAWSKKQTVLIGVLAGVLLCAAVFLIALLTHPSAAPATAPVGSTEAPRAVQNGAQDVSGALPIQDDVVTWIEESVFAPRAATTAAPSPVLNFRCVKMPENGAVLKLGESFSIGGKIYSNYPLDAVAVSISCSHNTKAPYPYRKTVHLKSRSVGVFSLEDGNTDEGVSLSELVDFSALQVGVHTLKLTATARGSRATELFRCSFYVVGDEWETITEADFPDSYPEALAFFGDPERFLYRYQWVNGRYIIADPDWEKTYIKEITGYPDAAPWRLHTDAVPYFEKAFEYLETSYVRVHGANGDTGPIKASVLITEYNGCYVARFTSSLKAISHHAFGTAVDVNASMDPNKNNDANTALIDTDVKEHLVYNGIITVDGIPCYDFTYDGSYKNDPNGVPQTCVNYLLYELGFFRAGFDWAHYYKSTSDAMHFCLSEFVTYKHEDPQFGLRKVFEYAEPVLSTPSPANQPDSLPKPAHSPKPQG